MIVRSRWGVDLEGGSSHSKGMIAATVLWLLAYALHLHAQSFVDQSMLARLQTNYGEAAYQRGVTLNDLLNAIKDRPEKQQLIEVNRFINAFNYLDDLSQWSEIDYWSTPEEFIGTHQGDCEDYVITKYFVLRALGVSEEKLYLTYVKSLNFNMSHMVLTYFKTPQSTPLVLDNYDLRILPATERKDLLPVYSFNVGELFLTNPSAGLGRKLPTDKIKNSKWTSLL